MKVKIHDREFNLDVAIDNSGEGVRYCIKLDDCIVAFTSQSMHGDMFGHWLLEQIRGHNAASSNSK